MDGMLRLAVPKGRIFEGVRALLADAGVRISAYERSYRPASDDPQLEIKILKPQNIAKLVDLGAHDIGFTGCDWICESESRVETLLDTGMDPVTLVAAVPEGMSDGELRSRSIVVASEYERLTKSYLDKEGYRYVYLRTYGATEVFPPEDADMIVDNRGTGRTLKENRLRVVAELMQSSTRFITSARSMEDPGKREKIDALVMLMRSVLEARQRVLLEMNVTGERLEALLKELPCMRAPTVQELAGGAGYAVKAAVPRGDLRKLLPRLKKLGATDILQYEIQRVML
jgi:ATP phosphoribosyltransferase